MPWWILLVTEIIKIIPDILSWIRSQDDKGSASKSFIDHVKGFEKK